MIELLDPVVESPPRDPTLGDDYWGFRLYAFLVGRRGAANAFLGRFEQARRDVAREAALLRDGSSTEGLIYPHLHQALVAETAGDAAAALQHTEHVAEQSERLGTPIHRGFSLALLTSCRFLGGDVDGANAVEEEARELLREYDITSLELYLVHARIGIAAAREDWDRAEQIAAEALPQMTDQRRHRALALVALAHARVASGAPASEVEDALAAAPGSLSIEELGSTRGTIQEVRGKLAAREGRNEDARAALAKAHRIYADMGASGHATRTAASL